ncbi:MAG: 16S rRNA (cytosine(1402)-N(4))-methyltransferase RsmH [Mycoplasma sp.]
MKVSNDHLSVLLDEVINGLSIKQNGTYIDLTSGRGGHSKKILDNLSENGKLIAVDRDEEAILYLEEKFSNDKRVSLFHNKFSEIKNILSSNGITSVDGITADLGVSSPQLDNIERGFSYHGEAKLDMRMDQTQSKDAIEVINKYPISRLITIFEKYGECKNSKSVAFAIGKIRESNPIITTSQFVEIIKSSIPKKMHFQDKHPARTYFQAIRIEVNNEFEEIEKGISDAIELLSPGGRLVIITFHSLEEKIIKNIFRKYTTNKLPNYLPINEISEYKIIKTNTVSIEEIDNNKRSRSAKLHIIERRINNEN